MTAPAIDVEATLRQQTAPLVNELLLFAQRLPEILREYHNLEATTTVMISPSSRAAEAAWEALRVRSGVTTVATLLAHVGGSIEDGLGGRGFRTLQAKGYTRAALLAALDPPDGLLS